jgi:hypothetical protein
MRVHSAGQSPGRWSPAGALPGSRRPSSEPDRLSDEDEVNAAGKLLVDLEGPRGRKSGGGGLGLGFDELNTGGGDAATIGERTAMRTAPTRV